MTNSAAAIWRNRPSARLPLWLQRSLAVLRLLRPMNLVMLAIGVALGAFLAGGAATFGLALRGSVLLAAVAVVLIGGGANALNDVFDVEADRVNRPGRPLASGMLSRPVAVGVWLVASGIGLAISAGLSAEHFMVAAVAVAAMFVYNYRLKRVAVAGNVIVSALVATTIIFGALLGREPGRGVVAAVFAFLVTLGREIIKDAEDVLGDDATGARTLPLLIGVRRSVIIACAIAVVVVSLTPVPFLMLGYSSLYLSIVLVADAFLLGAVWWALTLENVGIARASAWLKWAMLAGMAALAGSEALE